MCINPQKTTQGSVFYAHFLIAFVCVFFGMDVHAANLSNITPPDLPSFKASTAQKETPKDTIPVLTKRDDVTKLYRIKLQWKEASKAALFFYRNVGYLVFNKPGKLSPGTFPGDYFKSLEIIPHPQSLIVRFVLSDENDLLMSRQDDEWILVAGRQESEIPLQEYPLKVTPDKQTKTLAFLNDEAEPLISFKDPHSDDLFWVQPDLNRAVERPRELMTLNVLPTQLGVVYLEKDPRHLSVTVDKTNHLTLITLPDDLNGDLLLGSAPQDASTHEALPVNPLVNLGKYEVNQTTVFETTRMMRKDLALETDLLKKSRKEIELAKFYLATGAYFEATGVLKLIQERTPQIFHKHDDLILMHDMASILSHSMDDDDFLSNTGNFHGEPERSLILGIHAQRFGNYQEALKRYIEAYKLIQSLPESMRNDIALKAFEAAVESKFKTPLFEGLIQKENLTPRARDEFEYYHAKAAQLANPTLPMRETYSRLTFSTNRKIALLAHLALNDGNNKAPKSVLKDLESLRTTWRGDVYEQRLLGVLAELYQKAGQQQNALNCLRTIAVFLWKFERSHIYLEHAEDLFYDTFMAMKDAPVLKQIGFYYAFEDILPRGERFGKIIERITDLYLQVGLPDQAIDALNQRLKFLNFEKERGTIKDQDHTYLTNMTLKRIAEIALTRSDNALALKTLEKLIPFEADPTKAVEYNIFATDVRFMRARAHWGQTNYDDVLKDIDGLETTPAKRLRADVYMAQEKWPEALPILGALLATSEDKKIKSVLDVDAVLDLAVVASHLQNPALIDALKTDYLERIENPQKKQAFEIMISSPTPLDVTKPKITEQLAEAENYGKVMEDIKKDIMNTTWQDASASNTESPAVPATPVAPSAQAQVQAPESTPTAAPGP